MNEERTPFYPDGALELAENGRANLRLDAKNAGRYGKEWPSCGRIDYDEDDEASYIAKIVLAKEYAKLRNLAKHSDVLEAVLSIAAARANKAFDGIGKKYAVNHRSTKTGTYAYSASVAFHIADLAFELSNSELVRQARRMVDKPLDAKVWKTARKHGMWEIMYKHSNLDGGRRNNRKRRAR